MSCLNISLHRCLFPYLRGVLVPSLRSRDPFALGASNFYPRRRQQSRCAINSTNLLENLSWPRGKWPSVQSRG